MGTALLVSRDGIIANAAVIEDRTAALCDIVHSIVGAQRVLAREKEREIISRCTSVRRTDIWFFYRRLRSY